MYSYAGNFLGNFLWMALPSLSSHGDGAGPCPAFRIKLEESNGGVNLMDKNIICRFWWTDAFFLYTIGLFSSDSALSGCLYLLSFRKE